MIVLRKGIRISGIHLDWVENIQHAVDPVDLLVAHRLGVVRSTVYGILKRIQTPRSRQQSFASGKRRPHHRDTKIDAIR